MLLSGSDILVRALIEQGVDVVFGYPGGQVINIYDSLYKYQDELKHVLTAHEQGASHAADGYARATGKVGVVIATSGPGATNLVTGIATAYLDSVPMVAITGNVPNSTIGTDGFQEIDITGVTLPITKHNYFVGSVEDLADTVREAFKLAKSGRPGPVLIDIPKDVQIAKFDYEPAAPVTADETFPAKEIRIQQAAETINNAKRPFIYFGGGLITGISYAMKHLKPSVRVVGVMPEGSAVYVASRAAGKLVTLDKCASMADAVVRKTGEEYLYPYIEKYVDDLVTVSEEELRAAVKTACLYGKLTLEGAAALPLAAVSTGKCAVKDKTVLICSGSNIDQSVLNTCLQG